MKAAHLQLVPLALLACSPEAPKETVAARQDAAPRADAARPDVPAPTVEVPAAGPPPSGSDAILGAIAGPCGSEKAADFMGRAWSRETEAALKARTGAAEVLVMDPDGGTADVPPDDRRVDVLLDSRNRIIHLVCG